MSSTLFNVLFAWKCSSTHHKLALDALNQIRGDAAENWRNLCLKNIEIYLDGSKAPDNKFKDFKNHVLHVRENYWGGAIASTQKWYDATVTALRARKWADAVYSAGVLSHYYTDPIQPYHTGQSEAEGVVHRAAEWSIACAYRELTDILESDLGGWPEVAVPTGPDWLGQMVKNGADAANPHYQACIEHYDLKAGVKDPPSGLDQEMKDRIAKLIGHAVVGYARIMERALAEAEAAPPATSITLLGVMSQLTVPLFWVTKKLKDSKERAIVEATYKEFQATGKVIDTLTEDDYAIRAIHAEEVLKKALAELDAEKPTAIGTAHGQGAPTRPRSTATKSKPAAPPAPKTDTPARTPKVEIPATKLDKTPTTVSKVEPPKPQTAPAAVNTKTVETPATKPAPSAPTPSPTPPVTVAKADSPAEKRVQAEKPMPVEKPAAPKDTVAARDTLPAIRTEAPSPPPTNSSTNPPKPVVAAAPDHDRYYLDATMPIERAPSIGAKTAALLERQNILTVGDLMGVDPDKLAARMKERHIDSYTILMWQMQADLCCSVPNLRGHDAQILTACGISLPEELAAARPDALLKKVDAFVTTPEGERILRGGNRPDLKEVTSWIQWANHGEQSRAA